MSNLPQLAGQIGFGAAFLSFTGVLILVLASHPGTRQAYLLIAALALSMIWAGFMAYGSWADATAVAWLPVTEALHSGSWVCFVVALLMTDAKNQTARRIGIGILALTGVGVLATVLAVLAPENSGQAAAGGIVLFALLALPLLGLLALEQVIRNSIFGTRLLRPLAVGVGLIFMLDVFLYSQVFVFSEINLATWVLRGIGNAIAAPFVLVAIKRQRDWERELFLSRQVVFHTASLVAAGIYLLLLGLAGSFIGPFDGTGRALIELAVLAAAGAVFVYALFSTTLRRRLKVFIAKHFYRNRYDYRTEWLRLIETLAGRAAGASVAERGVRALAEIIESPGGGAWWCDEAGRAFEPCGAWNGPVPSASLARDSALVRFLAATGWVVDTDEYIENPELYERAFESDPAVLDPPSIYVPLILDGQLCGIVRLVRRPDLGRLGFEDHDLLKTAGKQVAVFLAQERIQASLAETKQFEAFSRLTTFLMHDLKNLISQQELVVGNAQRFKHKPEFVDDAIRTIESGVRRMRQVLERLQSHARSEGSSNVDLGKLLVEVVNACSDRQPAPELHAMPVDLHVAVDKEKLAMALTHAIRNAQDATPASGSILVSAVAAADNVVVDIADTGVGMTPEFIRDRLFKPFDSTKGAQGMGIGAYQVRETLRAFGGDVDVRSSPGQGTQLIMTLPLAARAAGGRATGRTAA